MKRNKRIISVSIFVIYVNIVLALFKAIIGFLSNSIAIILDAVNNLSDVLSSAITIVGSKLSSKKPDKGHPYGHGRIEYFSAVIISVIIVFTGISCLKESIRKIINPVQANYSVIALIFIIATVITKILLSKYVKSRGKELNSNSLRATGIDAMWDSIISFSTFITAIISIYMKINLEGYVGVLISVLILKSGMEILKGSIDDMIGIRADKRITNKLKRRISSYDEVLGVHDLSIHNYGPNSMIATAHIDVLESTTAKEIHRLTREIATDVYDRYGIILTIGIYASNKKNKYQKIKNYLEEQVNEYENILEIHGIYVDEDINEVSFDVIFDFDEENQKKIITELKNKLKEKFPDYDYNIIIDKDISD